MSLNKQQFIETIAPYAIEGQRVSGKLASLTLAQAILESGWGKEELAVNAKNLYGVKASDEWKGPIYNKHTKEWVGAKYITVNAPFRKYVSWEESTKDHIAFFTSTPWRTNAYKDILSARDYRTGAKALGDSPYATDPNYEREILRVIEENKLYKYDEGVDVMKRHNITICIDYGHGGVDPGAIGFSLQEKRVTLAVGEKLRLLLISLGFNVVVTRMGDASVSLAQRANIANIAKADLFISIHCNAAPKAGAYGFETFCYPGAVGGYRMAKHVQDCIEANTQLYQVGRPQVNRGVKSEYFTVLTNTAMEAVLAEMAFITNKEDNNILRTQQEGFAQALANAVCKYYNVPNNPVEEELPEPKDTPVEEKHWGEEYFNKLNEVGIVMHEKRFEEAITRAETAALIYRGYKKGIEDCKKMMQEEREKEIASIVKTEAAKITGK